MCLYFLFLFEKFFLSKPPWSKQVPGCSQLSLALSQESCSRPCTQVGASAALVPGCQGLYCPYALFLLSDLSMSPIFGLRSSYMLEYCWLFSLVLRSARYFTGIEGKSTLLPPISLPSSCLPHSPSYFNFKCYSPPFCALFLFLTLLISPAYIHSKSFLFPLVISHSFSFSYTILIFFPPLKWLVVWPGY